MLDLGLSFLGSVARDPHALAVVDGELGLTYGQWYRRISALVAGLDSLGLAPGDRIVTALQNRWEAATLHWACQFAGVIITPVNWRSTAGELDFFLQDAEAKAVVYEETSAAAVSGSQLSTRLPRIALDSVSHGDTPFTALTDGDAPEARPRVNAEAWSVMLYTSGTTARPKGVPRRQRAERAAALAHVAQNLYGRSERTLGVMNWPLPAKKARSLPFLPAMNPSTATGIARTPTPKRSARAGISLATPASSIPMATFSSPAGSTT